MMHGYLSTLANHLWQSTLFAGVAGLLALALRRNYAATRYWLWTAASLKFLVPFALLVSAGSHIQWRAASPISQTGLVSVMKEIGVPFAPAAPTTSPRQLESVDQTSRTPIILFAVWLCGSAVVAFAWFREWLRVRQTIKAASPLRLKIPITALSTPTRAEPGVVGIFRPVLLLPEGITDRLTEGQLEAILVHELCHVRRRDNLAALIHMVVETLFWFHPLVWWIERRLMEERERACDEEVLRVVGDPHTYAEGILNVCKFYKESPLVCMSGVTGSNLKNRIEAIMTNRIIHNLSVGRTLLLAAAALAAVAVPIAFGMARTPQNVPNAAAPPIPIENQIATENAAPLSEKGEQKDSPGWLDGIESQGYRGLGVDQLIRLKGIGVDAKYIREIRAAGFQLTVDDLVRFRGHGITPDFVKAIKETGLRGVTSEGLIRLTGPRVDPDWIQQIQSLGYPNLSVDDVVRLRGQGITPEYIREAQKRFKDISIDNLIRLKGNGIL
jgi:beta-lactamase regulating signal transducer with metallopeptidase domain